MPELDPQAFRDKFGRKFVGVRDRTLRNMRRELKNAAKPSHASHQALRELLGSKTESEKLNLIAQYAIEAFCHDLFSMLEETEEFTLDAVSGGGAKIDLKTDSNLFAAEPEVWCEKYSKLTSVTDWIVDRTAQLLKIGRYGEGE